MNPVKLPSIVVIFFCAVLCAFALCVTQAEVPKLINYQGKLTTPEGALVDTTVSMQFSIYSDSTGGDPLWTETQTSVKVDKGIFNVLLGSVNEIPESVFTGNIRYLGVKVGDDPEMIPRKPIVSVGYAYNSDMLDARHAGNDNGNIPVNNGMLNVNLNADYLDGFDSQTLISSVKTVIRDTMVVACDESLKTDVFTPAIDPSKSVVILDFSLLDHINCCGSQWLELFPVMRVCVTSLTPTSITVRRFPWYGPGWCNLFVAYQIIEYK